MQIAIVFTKEELELIVDSLILSESQIGEYNFNSDKLRLLQSKFKQLLQMKQYE